jgi:internalin A
MPAKLVKNIIVFCLVFVLLPATSIWAASVIRDPALAKAIRAELKLSTNKEVTAAHLQKLESLYPQESKDKITSLQGLEYAVNMQSLFLPGQKIRNITPLSKLKKLTFVAVDGNQIRDLSPLSGLSSLQSLIIDHNKITSLAPLKNLTKLTDLLADNNQIADLSPLQKLKLKWLTLSNNTIQDLTPLKNHPTLENLYLEGNLIQDIKALETMPKLKEVYLADNPLNKQSEQVIQNLEDKGVKVSLADTDEAAAE